MNPQEQYPQGYGAPVQPGSPNIMTAVENAAPEQLDVSVSQNGSTQMNVVNAVNANGVISGRKVVDYIWQRIAICAMVIGGGLLVAIIVLVFIMNNINVANAKQESATTEANNKLNDIYSALKVEDQSAALSVIGQDQMLSGSDIAQIKTLLTKKYGSVTAFDPTDSAINLVKTNGVYKVVSLKMTNAAGTARALLYAKLADNQWKMAAFDSSSEKNPCKNSTDEEKEALAGIVKCPSVVVEDDEEEE